MNPRLLIISDQADFVRLLEQHVSTIWKDAAVRRHDLAAQGSLPVEFTAAGYDAVLLDHLVQNGRGLRWLHDLARRAYFPPIIYFLPGDDEVVAAQARQAGAVESLPRVRPDHRRLAEILRKTVSDRRRAMTLWRSRPEADAVYRFGGVRIRGHRCIRQLAAGGHSQVFLAESEKAGELVVLKVFREVPDKVDAHDTFNRFLQEYELVSAIRHPNVVRIHDLGIADDHAYIAMEYFPRGDLRKRMKMPIAPREAVAYIGQMAAALAVIHRVGVLHRDLKPGNVMLREDGTLALIDFGLAKQLALQAEITGTGEIFGTPYYMSPEQGHGEPVDERSDLYSLGVLLYEMLMRRKPYLGQSLMSVIYLHRNGPLPELGPALKAYEPLVQRLMAKSPADRFQSAAELGSAVETLLTTEAA